MYAALNYERKVHDVGGSGEPMSEYMSGAERLVLFRDYAPRYPSFSKPKVNWLLHPLLLPFEVPSQGTSPWDNKQREDENK